MRRRDPRSNRILLLTLFSVAALACGGLVPLPGGDGADPVPAHGLDVGDPAVDAAIDAALREQAARDAMVEAMKAGAQPSRAADVDAAWRAVFGETAPTRSRR